MVKYETLLIVEPSYIVNYSGCQLTEKRVFLHGKRTTYVVHPWLNTAGNIVVNMLNGASALLCKQASALGNGEVDVRLRGH
jgi:hypothetical protein